MEKHAENVLQKQVPDPFGKEPKIPFKELFKMFWKRLIKWLSKIGFYFCFEPNPFLWTSSWKTKET